MTHAMSDKNEFDLDTLDVMGPAETGATIELEHPISGEPLLDGDGKPWSVTVRGEDSATVKAVIRKQQDRRNDRIRKNRGPGLDAASYDTERVEKLVAATIGWHIIKGGAPLEFNARNARMVYSDDKFAWLVEQVEDGMRDRQRFFPKPSAS